MDTVFFYTIVPFAVIYLLYVAYKIVRPELSKTSDVDLRPLSDQERSFLEQQLGNHIDLTQPVKLVTGMVYKQLPIGYGPTYHGASLMSGPAADFKLAITLLTLRELTRPIKKLQKNFTMERKSQSNIRLVLTSSGKLMYYQ